MLTLMGKQIDVISNNCINYKLHIAICDAVGLFLCQLDCNETFDKSEFQQARLLILDLSPTWCGKELNSVFVKIHFDPVHKSKQVK